MWERKFDTTMSLLCLAHTRARADSSGNVANLVNVDMSAAAAAQQQGGSCTQRVAGSRGHALPM